MSFEAKFTTKLKDLSIDEPTVEQPIYSGPTDLEYTVKSFLRHHFGHDEKTIDNLKFDFLIGGKLLRQSVEEHLRLYSDELDVDEILSEKLVEVEYLLSLEPPVPLEALPQDDWVSCVDVNQTHIVTGSYDNTIRIYNLDDRKLQATISDAHGKPVTKVKIVNLSSLGSSKDELHFISCSHDEISYLHRYNKKTRKSEIVFKYAGHNRSVNCVDVSDDLVATGSFDKTLRLWSLGPDENEEPGARDNPPPSDSEGSKKNSKKQKTKASEKSIAKTSRSAIMTLTGHQESITGVKWMCDCNEFKSVASCSMDGSICIWDIEVGECKRRLHSNKPLLGIDFCPKRNIIISASCDRFVRVWDARAPNNASAKAAYISHSAWVSSVALGQPSTNHFVSGGYDNLVKLWDLRSSKACLYDLIGHHDKVLDVNWSNPSFVLSGSADSTLKIFATKS